MQTETQQNDIFVLDGRVRLLQPDDGGFRTSLDSVMVAAACPARAGETLLDMGCGVGSAGLCVMARVNGIQLTGVEIQSAVAALATRNTALNNAGDQAIFINADIRDFTPDQMFDHVICNPPYLESGTYTPSPDDGRNTALGHHGTDMTLDDWLRAAHRLVKSRGSITLIHRADHIDRIIQGLGKRFGAIEIIPLWPHAGEDARRVIIRAIKDRRDAATIRAGIILHEMDGSWTTAADNVLRHMAAI